MTIIDNENRTMTKQLRSAMPHSKKIDIAVGYFFVSGFAQIMDYLDKIEESDNPNHVVRVLTSPVTDKPTKDALLASNEADEDIERMASRQKSASCMKQLAINNMRLELEHMPQTSIQAKAIRKLVSLIHKHKVKIRVYTREQLHAKLYLFNLEDRVKQESIIGSSNFSISGLQDHAELNFLTNDESHYRDFLGWFDRHWDDPSCKTFTEDAVNVLENSWAGSRHTPRDVAGKASIHENPESGEVEPGSIELYDFQREAVSKAIKKIGDYGGVMISDVVGTGKTYIGAAILIHLLKHDVQYPLIICPARLVDMWEGIREKYGIPCSVLSNSQLDDLSKYDYCDVILIDESHAFKDDRRIRHAKLAEHMENKTVDAKIIMLTATPISNTVLDLKNQLKLFPSDTMERIPVLEETPARANRTKLDVYFAGVEDDNRTATTEGKEKIRELLRYVLIRRTRKQILAACPEDDNGERYVMKNGRLEYFPKPVLYNLEYDAEKTYDGNFEEIEDTIGSLSLGRYTPGKYIKKSYRDTPPYDDLANLISLGGIVLVSLLKRLESSIKAFDSSISRYKTGHEWFLGQLEEGKVAVGKEFQEIIRKLVDNDSDDVEIEKELRDEMGRTISKYDADAFEIDKWKRDISDDIRKFAKITKLLQGREFTERDDKLHKLLELVNQKQEKLLIFTESSVTAKYIHRYIARNVRTRNIVQLDSESGKKIIDESVAKFAPEFNGGKRDEKDQIDILISTDILAEGLNLQAGRIIINYDFHWNPVRLIQRIGRIDRLGSEHKQIEIHNFLTTPTVDKSLNLLIRVRSRIDTIRAILGTGSRVLESTEPLDADDVCDIYDGKDAVLDPKVGGSILDLEDTESEKLAELIRHDSEKQGLYDRLPLGIRASTGSARLLVACSAEDVISYGSSETAGNAEFRRYYEVTEGGIRSISQSSFLRQLTSAANDPPMEEAPNYNELISAAWARFGADSKGSMRYVPTYKFQKHFDSKLSNVTDPGLQRRILAMRKFVLSRMVQQKHPYRDLRDLYRETKRSEPSHDELLERLEKIHRKYGKTEFKKIIRKPRILYSMMMGP